MTLAVSTTYPQLYVEAGLLDDFLSTAGEFLWPEKSQTYDDDGNEIHDDQGNPVYRKHGPLENIFRFADFGTWLMPMGPWFVFYLLASLLGYDFQRLGQWLDDILELKTPEDLLGKPVTSAIKDILGKLSPQELNDLQQAAVTEGVIQAPMTATSGLDFPLFKKAAPPAAATEKMKKKIEEQNKKIKELQEQAKIEKEKAKKELAHEKGKVKEVSKEKGQLAKEKGSLEKQVKGMQGKLDAVKHSKDDPRVRAARENYAKAIEANAPAKTQQKLKSKLNKEIGNAKRAAKWEQKSTLQKFFGKGSVAGATASKGLLGGIVVAFTNALSYAKTIIGKVAKGGLKGFGKFAFKHPILTAIGTAGLYAWYNFSDDEEEDPEPGPEVPTNQSVFTEEAQGVIKDAGESKGIKAKMAPESYGAELGMQVNSILSGAGVSG